MAGSEIIPKHDSTLRFKEGIFMKNILRDMYNEDGFLKFLQLWKRYIKDKKTSVMKHCKSTLSTELYGELDKKGVIIFKVNHDKIKKVELNKKKKVFFPFNNIFLECPMYHREETLGGICYGVLFIKTILDNGEPWIIAVALWELHDSYGNVATKPCFLMFRENELFSLNESSFNDQVYTEDGFRWGEFVKQEVINNIKRLITCIDKKEYTTYRKWSPNGTIEKPIVYAYDVKTHLRHFWDDTGYFKIPNMSKEELKEKGYDIHEVVYKDGRLERDIPCKLIGSFKVNEDKERKQENRKIILLEKRVFRQEEKLLKILQEIFSDEYIKRHDRKVLKGLELDFLLREIRLAFEYDGEQHFDKKLCEEVFKSDFDALQKRDRKKDKLCKKKNITLIRIKYDEPLTKTYIKKKIKEIKK